ncbi:MAG: GNAT family N-acetyltransferase [Ferruginibacter sp.]
MTTFKRTHSGDSDFKNLVALLDEGLRKLDGDDHAFYAQFNKVDNIDTVIVCYDDGKPTGCGAFKEYDQTKVEIKRMFVLPQNRGQGIGLDILKALELWAAELNYTGCILETGKRQPEAIRMYKKAGYTIIKNFGQYENDENSVCMLKVISPLSNPVLIA